ncbi:MAG: hypothetical protein HUU28_18130, partial [Planctomycetaceae bacterium]|nr:hypothetical protein [Planctomycetaceae bacterium]
RDLKLEFILAKVAETLGLRVTEEEVNNEIARIARRYGRRFDRVRDELHERAAVGRAHQRRERAQPLREGHLEVLRLDAGGELDLQHRPAPRHHLRVARVHRQRLVGVAHDALRRHHHERHGEREDRPEVEAEVHEVAQHDLRHRARHDDEVVLVEPDLDHVRLDLVLGARDALLPRDALEHEQREHAEHPAPEDQGGGAPRPVGGGEQDVEERRHRAVEAVQGSRSGFRWIRRCSRGRAASR